MAGYALRYDEKTQTESEFVAALLCDTLQPDAKGQQGTWAGQHRRLQLMDYAKVGKWGIGDEKVAAIREHPTPCAELWKRRGTVDKKREM